MENTELGSLLRQMFDADEILVDMGGGMTVPLNTALMFHAALTYEDPTAAIEPPARGTPAYNHVIRVISHVDAQESLIQALGFLWNDYGWRGVRDVLVRWICEIEAAPDLHPKHRDMFGVVDLGSLVLMNPDEEHQIRIAAARAGHLADTDGTPYHQEFAAALDTTEHSVSIGTRWQPHFRKAFEAAHQTGSTTRDVFAALFHAPDRDSKHNSIQAALFLGAAAAGVRGQSQDEGFSGDGRPPTRIVKHATSLTTYHARPH